MNESHKFDPLFIKFNSHKGSQSTAEKFDLPIRAKILNQIDLAALALNLSRTQSISKKRFFKAKVYSQFDHNKSKIEEVYNAFYRVASRGNPVPPGAEWILDNYYVIDEQIQQTEEYLPRGYYRQLPKLGNTAEIGLPRVYNLTLNFIRHTDALINPAALSDFIRSFQTENYLRIGEIWAIPIMLRLGLIENLRRISEIIVIADRQRKLARDIIKRVTSDHQNDLQQDNSELLITLANTLNRYPELTNLGAIYLLSELRAKTEFSDLASSWLKEKFIAGGYELAKLVELEEFLQATNQISIGNTINSLKNIGVTDWSLWFETNNQVAQVLSDDSSGVYSASDFTTRDNCRNQIELIAKRTKRSELTIAKNLLQFQADQSDPQASLVDYLLTADKRFSFVKSLGLRVKISERISARLQGSAFYLYLGVVLLTTFLLSVSYGGYFGLLTNNLLAVSLLMLCFLIIFSELTIQFVHWLLLLFIAPKSLPKLNWETPIADTLKTAVVVNTIINTKEKVREAISELEIRYLANTDHNITYVILADFKESSKQVENNEAAINLYAQKRINLLNTKYSKSSKTGSVNFYFLFRSRVFSNSENIFMGWERKRGKLSEFNRLLLNPDQAGTFVLDKIDLSGLANIRYVVTLDSDTVLPANSVRKLVATIAHPSNQAKFDEQSGTVKSGYGIIQPQVITSLESSNASQFSIITSANSGIDPYSSLVSEVYQDIFGEASFIGKGIYDLAIFEKVLGNLVPNEALLSHDLFEGNLVRCGLASDVVLIENIPSKYNVELSRINRWVRGDWQLLPWLKQKVPNYNRKLVANPISLLGRWKIIDNLRRSLVSVASLVAITTLLFFDPTVKAAAPLILLFSIPVITQFLNFILIVAKRDKLVFQLRYWSKVLVKNLQQITLNFSFLPKLGVSNLIAIFKTLYRVFYSKKRLLSWVTADFAEKKFKSNLTTYLWFFWPNYLLVAAGVIICWVSGSHPIGFYALVMPLWLSAPLLAFIVSRPQQSVKEQLGSSQQSELRDYAQDTWQYFADHLTAEYNYLMPDNIQMVPSEHVANRTSPTNIGLSMLAVSSAYDLGFINLTQTTDYLKNIIRSVKNLDSFSGQLYNWYNPKSLQPLHPHYISFVDSSNLIAYCLTIKQNAKEFFHSKWFRNPGDLKLSYQTIFSQLRHTPESEAYTDFLSYHPWADELFRNQSELSAGLSADQERSFTSLLQVLDTKEPTLTLSKKLSLRLLSLARELGAFADATGVTDPSVATAAAIRWQQLAELAETALTKIDQQAEQIRKVISDLNKIVDAADFDFLYNTERKVFSIGYNLESAQQDNSYYDILASEARVGSLVAIALGKAPAKHWFHLSRSLTNTPAGKCLYSWTGTMFEYLLPNIICEQLPNSLLAEANLTAVNAQIAYADAKNVPWGISESAHAGVNFEQTYQYRAFGVPDLSLKNQLNNDLVISPYSTCLALEILPLAALKNLERIKGVGGYGKYGFYEAIDYTPERLSKNEQLIIVKTFFAHHQSMSLCAINNLLNGDLLKKRFHSEPRIKAVELLLHEKFPEKNAKVLKRRTEQVPVIVSKLKSEAELFRSIQTPFTKTPVTHVLSNGSYSSVVDNRGTGYSYLRNQLQLNPWQRDPAQSAQGSFVYLKDQSSGFTWSNTYAPTMVMPDRYSIDYFPDKVVFKREDRKIICQTTHVVSAEHNLEVRSINLTNQSANVAKIQLTSATEVALAKLQDFKSHPAFLRTFVQTEFVPELDALIFKRRPRRTGEQPSYMFHQLSLPVVWQATRYDCDRMNFIGRYRSLANPAALTQEELSNITGDVLDPIASLQTAVEIKPGFSAQLSYVTGYADSYEDACSILRLYQQQDTIRRTFDLAWSIKNVEIRNEHFSIDQNHSFQKIANAVFIHLPKTDTQLVGKEVNLLPRSDIWRFGISGDKPIITLEVFSQEDLGFVQELLLAHEFLRRMGVKVDLVIISHATISYFHKFYRDIEYLIQNSPANNFYHDNQEIFLFEKVNLSEQDILLIKTLSCLNLNAKHGTIDEQVKIDQEHSIPLTSLARINQPPAKKSASEVIEDVGVEVSGELNNQVGSFIEDGKAYRMLVNPQVKQPPLPWINVLANPEFGTIVSESGSGFSWATNSRENRISSWSNDPIKDPVSEIIYIRNIETGEFWSLTPAPAPLVGADYEVIHRFGSTSFSHVYENLRITLRIHVSPDQPVKWFDVSIDNPTNQSFDFEVYSYTELVLGINRSNTFNHIVTEFDQDTKLLTAKNHFNNEFAGQTICAGSSDKTFSYTCDRKELVGATGSLSNPELFVARDINNLMRKINADAHRIILSGTTGTDLDSIFLLQTKLTVKPKTNAALNFHLGMYENKSEIPAALLRQDLRGSCNEDFAQADTFWQEKTSKIQVSTPDRSFDILLNGWLVYQNLACRIYGRSAFYQSGGAFGFRDQLQDAMSTVYVDPELTRSQILLHAAHQFTEGDVQHWWHPPTGRGTRTRISDDLLWLPYVTAVYLEKTGDTSILEEQVPYLEAAPLAPEQHDAYIDPSRTEEKFSLLDHCIRALDYSLQFGVHDIPLIRGGDWNDGMDLVGAEGKGESVWLGWFLADNLLKVGTIISESMPGKAQHYRDIADRIRAGIEEHAWDGSWYLRAFYDDGTPLGSASSEECQIDSLAQSWGVITGLADAERAETALQNVDERLVDRDLRIIKLLTPAFRDTEKSPGYIKSYLPGVRENGAQYTHAATWVILAAAMKGQTERAFDLFQLINPVDITKDASGAQRYKGEPYVTCGDVISNPQHPGRAGWSWYTGSGGWLYRVGIEFIIGLKLFPDGFEFAPCVPQSWPEFSVELKLDKNFSITLKPGEDKSVELNGRKIDGKRIVFADAGDGDNQVTVVY